MSSRNYCPACNSSTGLGDVHCFKCGYRQNIYNNTDGYFTDLKGRQEVLALRSDLELIPARFSPKALQWLYSAGIHDDVIVKQRIGYCKDIDKVLIPAFNNEEELMFYQLRSLQKSDKCKYVSYGKMANYTIQYNDAKSKTLVIVEDHCSAIRLKPFLPVVALSGTSIKWDIAQSVVRQFNKIIFWLDPDSPGRSAMWGLFYKLRYYANKGHYRDLFLGVNTDDVGFYRVDYRAVDKDPKCYLDNEIKDILQTKVIICA